MEVPVQQDIPGCQGYQATNEGGIFDVRRGKLKSLRPAGNGALKVDIGKSTRMVHDLVARAFHGRPPARGYRVKHLNDDLSDNRPENLVWAGTPKSGTQAPTISRELEREYERERIDRLALIELMTI
jgi:hypothetical protein